MNTTLVNRQVNLEMRKNMSKLFQVFGSYKTIGVVSTEKTSGTIKKCFNRKVKETFLLHCYSLCLHIGWIKKKILSKQHF
jgi:hypothetical protein